MTTVKHWDIREYIADFRSNPGGAAGVEARYVLLDYLILRANARLRTHVNTKRIMKDTGFGKEAVAGALKWLFERGAAYNVPYRYRVGDEAKRHKRSYLYQLTGVIYLREQWVPYLLLNSERQDAMRGEWENMGIKQLPFLGFGESHVGSETEPYVGSESERSDSEHERYYSTFFEDSTNPQDVPASNPADLPSGHQPARRAPGKKNRIASTNPYLQGSISIPESTTAALNGGSEGSDITGRALYRWLVTKANNGRPLKKSAVSGLQGKIVILGGYGSKTEYPNLLDCYDNLPGFALFCEESLDMFVRTRGGLENVDASDLISFLRDFANRKEGKAKRWLAWTESNPEQCVPVERPSDADLEARREADAQQARRDAEHAVWKVGFDAREKECASNWETPDDERPEHLRGLRTVYEWDYYTRHNLTLAQQREMAENGTLPSLYGWS